ncbi:zinc finger BED domain-containing protein 5-like [Watersipora subatra]|uniref:zinc finger BED domain-containing protein 5-like n=1 Tax=Watersipora subatra TaxID=2589382 RepID=UPI00355BBAC3
MSENIKKQLVEEIRNAPFGLFSIQLDESIDVELCAQLLAIIRYVNNENIKEEFLFRSALKTTMRASDIFDKVLQIFETEKLSWENLCNCCTDAVPSMLGSSSGFQTRVKQLVPDVKGVHCMIHRQALAAKTFPKSFSAILNQVFRIVNYIKGVSLNSRLFKELCENMEAEHQVLLYHTNVYWLFKGNVTARTFKLREEIKIFCEQNNKAEFKIWLKDEVWLHNLAYLANIFDQINKLNCQMQGRNTNIVKFTDALKAFLCKLELWRKKLAQDNFSMFELLSLILEPKDKESISMPESLQSNIISHLGSLKSEFRHYFPEVSESEPSLVRNDFRCFAESLPDELQEELIDLQKRLICQRCL